MMKAFTGNRQPATGHRHMETTNRMNRNCILGAAGIGLLLWVWLGVWAGPLPNGVAAQGQDESTVLLTIRLRDSDGRFVTDEPVSLSRLPEEETAVVCTTDAQGECAWPVTRGLYQLLFARPLDGVNAVLLGEGGLRGLGVTVGETPITYHFTFHSDDYVYFDLAPDLPVPLPKIPSLDLIHHHGEFGEEGHAHDEGEGEIEIEPLAPDDPLDDDPPAAFAFSWLLWAAGAGASVGFVAQRLSVWYLGRKQPEQPEQAGQADEKDETPDEEIDRSC
jgi:hypothetical protein